MKAQELYDHLELTIGSNLKPSDINKGQAFFWKEKRTGSNSTRVLRVHENAAGTIVGIKLPVSSRRKRVETTISLPTTADDVIAAVRKEIALLERF